MKHEQLAKGNELVAKINNCQKDIEYVKKMINKIQTEGTSVFLSLNSAQINIENEIGLKAAGEQIKLYEKEIASLEKEFKAL